LAFFKIQCIFLVMKKRTKCSPKPKISEPGMSISMLSAQVPAITTEPLALRSPSFESNCDAAKCAPVTAQAATKGATAHLQCTSAATKDPTEIGYGEHPDGSLIAPASNATSLDNCAPQTAASNLHEKGLKEFDPPLGRRTSQGIKVKPDYDEISARRLAGMKTFHCWQHYVDVNAGVPTYGKAMFYKLVRDHEKHQVSRTHPETPVHSLPIP
jgi:hypothetical protein